MPGMTAGGGLAPLLDEIGPAPSPRDDGRDDVRNAMRTVAHEERKNNFVDRYGSEALRTAEMWGARTQEIGPAVAREARIAYETAPRPSAKAPEEDRNEGDHVRSAREAFHQASRKPAAAERQHGREIVDRMELRHGGVEIIDRFADFDRQFRENPADAERRLAAEIATSHNEAIANHQALQEVRSYEAKHQLSPDERQVMQQLLLTGRALGMQDAHKQARYLLGSDIEDPWKRDVVSAQRQADQPALEQAKAAVAEFQSRHPDVDPGRWERMRSLLQHEKARSLDEAFAMTRPSR